jgi:ubiquinone biosynthesis protein UbiJ
MLDPDPEVVRREIASVSRRLQILAEEFRKRGTSSDASQALLDRVQQHKDRLAEKLSDAERTGNWPLVRDDFASDWNSLIVDLETLEARLTE